MIAKTIETKMTTCIVKYLVFDLDFDLQRQRKVAYSILIGTPNYLHRKWKYSLNAHPNIN